MMQRSLLFRRVALGVTRTTSELSGLQQPALRFLMNQQVKVERNAASAAQFQSKRTLLTAQRAVVFPPDGKRPLFIYAVFIFTSAAWEIWNFFASRNALEDIGRKARSGETIFGATQTARALVLLDAYANTQETLWGDSSTSEADFPNMVPRIIRSGGLEAIRNALQSSDQRVVAAAAELARTFSVRPHGAKLLMNDDAIRNSLISAFEKAVNSKVCKDCGGSSAFEMFSLTEALRNCLAYYPFGANPDADSRLKASLNKLSARAAAFAEKQRVGMLPDADFGFPWGSESGHPWLPPAELANHDSHWFLHISNVLVDLAVQASFLKPAGSAGGNAALTTILEPTLANLNRMFRAGVLDEEEEVYFGLICMEALQRSKGLDPALLESIDEFSKSMFFKHSWSRRIVRGFIDNADFLSTVIFAGAFGYMWGVARTLFSLRDVTPPPPANTASPGNVPSIVDQIQRRPGQGPPVPSPANARGWRWMMSRKYGGRAALGAMGFTLWAHLATTTFGKDVWIDSDALQVTYFSTRVLAGVLFAGYLFKNFPFFFFPSVAARMTDISDVDEGSVHISIGPRSIGGGLGGRRPSSPGDNNKPSGGGGGGQWT